MSERDKRNKQASVIERAADWHIRLRDKNLSEADQQRYVEWLRQSPDHVAEMLRMERLRGALTRVLSDREPSKH